MKVNTDHLNTIASPRSTDGARRSALRMANLRQRQMSQDIALALRYHLNVKGLSPEDLARETALSPAEIQKILQGAADLSLSGIATLEKALGITLIQIPRPYEQQ